MYHKMLMPITCGIMHCTTQFFMQGRVSQSQHSQNYEPTPHASTLGIRPLVSGMTSHETLPLYKKTFE